MGYVRSSPALVILYGFWCCERAALWNLAASSRRNPLQYSEAINLRKLKNPIGMCLSTAGLKEFSAGARCFSPVESGDPECVGRPESLGKTTACHVLQHLSRLGKSRNRRR